jgi:predicted lipoprotein with Yx(FWY)xxD motif
MDMNLLAIEDEAGRARPMTRSRPGRLALRRSSGFLAAVSLAALALAACGSGSSSGSTTTTTTTQQSPSPSTSFSTANVGTIGTVLVDGSGRTVYELSSGSKKNLPCTASTGCTSVWTPLPLPSGTSSASASGGANSSLLSTISSGGVTYPTYNGWVLYEFTGDSGSGQAQGQGISSFGGTWHVLDGTGTPITASPSSQTTTTYHY